VADVEFTVTDWRARRYAIQQDIAEMAGRIAAAAAGNTPRHTGTMAGSWQVVPGADPGTSLVINTAPHARFVEYGTRYRRADAPLGRARAAAG
jgi:hypothetical protein